MTGASGLIGSRITRELEDDYEVVGLDLEEPGDDGPAHWIRCDLTHDESVASALERVRAQHGRRIEAVVHLAAYYDFGGAPSPLYDRLTVEGTRRLLERLRGFQVGQVVFSSSLLVMRPARMGDVLTEASPVEAEWEYPRSKLDAERVIRDERGSVPAVILRIAGVYDEDCHSIPIGHQMARIFERKLESYFFPGDARHGQSYVHLDDVARCFQAVIEHRDRLRDHELFLIGEPEVMSYGELQDALGTEIHGRDWPTIRIPATVAKAAAWIKDKTPGQDPFIKPWMVDLADAHMPVSVAKARAKLDWAPRRRLAQTVPEMARRLVTNPRAWYAENGIEVPDDLAALERRRARRGRGGVPSRG